MWAKQRSCIAKRWKRTAIRSQCTILLFFLNSSTHCDSKEVFSAVEDLGADLLSLPVLSTQLRKARDLVVDEISGICAVEMDEFDDCLTYVKVVNGRL